MKIFNRKNLLTIFTGMTLAVAGTVPSLSYARGGDHDWGFERAGEHRHDGDHQWGPHRGFDRGHHWGHQRGHGKRRGHDNERNPWYWYYKAKFDKDNTDEDPVDTGVDVDITFNDKALNPGTTFNATYNSTMTVQEVLADLLGDSTDGYYLQECYEYSDPIAGTYNDCAPDETLAPLDGSLTLEAAGIVDDPEVYLVHTAP